MTVLYVDSSAFVKLYVTEDQTETEQVERALQQNVEVASCLIAYAEVCGTFGRQFQQGRLDDETYWATRRAFEADWENVNATEVTPELSSLAADLLKSQTGLRAMDALHLASALVLRTQQPLKFLSFDKLLNAAAQALMPDAF